MPAASRLTTPCTAGAATFSANWATVPLSTASPPLGWCREIASTPATPRVFSVNRATGRHPVRRGAACRRARRRARPTSAGGLGGVCARLRRLRGRGQRGRRERAHHAWWPSDCPSRVRLRRSRAGAARGRANHLSLGLNHQNAHGGRGHAAARPETALARRPRHALHPRAATGARPVRLYGRRHDPDAAVALRRVSKSHVAVQGGETVGAVRADAVGTAGGDAAVPGGRLCAGVPLQLFEPGAKATSWRSEEHTSEL